MELKKRKGSSTAITLHRAVKVEAFNVMNKCKCDNVNEKQQQRVFFTTTIHVVCMKVSVCQAIGRFYYRWPRPFILFLILLFNC